MRNEPAAMTLDLLAQPEERIPVMTTRQYRDTQVDVRLVICGLWITMLFVFAYVDIFALFRADVLGAALDGKIANTAFTVNQVFLISTLIYILPSILMVVLTLVLRPRVNRTVNIVVSFFYMITIIVSCIGETWVYYFLGGLIDVILLVVIVRVAWKWPLLPS